MSSDSDSDSTTITYENKCSGIQIIFDPLKADQYMICHPSLTSTPGHPAHCQEHATQLSFYFDAEDTMSADMCVSMRDPLTISGWNGITPMPPAHMILQDVNCLPGIHGGLSSGSIEDWEITRGLVESAIRAALDRDGYYLSNDILTTNTIDMSNCTLLGGKGKPVIFLGDNCLTTENGLVLTAAATWDEKEGFQRDVHLTWAPDEQRVSCDDEQVLERAKRWLRSAKPGLEVQSVDGRSLRGSLIRHQAQEHESFQLHMQSC